MKHSKLFLFVLLLISAHISYVFAQTNAVKAKVVGITDGDTVTVLAAGNRQIKIRLAGIDAPESRQNYGYAAKQKLSDLIFGKNVTVVIYKEDRYGRTIAKILLNGRDINLAMVEAGFAWHYKEYEKEQEEADRRLYAEAEIRARTLKTALWSLPNPVKPSDFRKNKETESSQQTSTGNGSAATRGQDRVIIPVPPTSGLNNGSSDTGGKLRQEKKKRPSRSKDMFAKTAPSLLRTNAQNRIINRNM